jgi:hypothetical protein
VIVLLGPIPASEDLPVVVRREKEFLLISMVNYEGPVHDFDRDELTRWRSGFYLELATRSEHASFEKFKEYASAIRVTDTWRQECARRIEIQSAGHHMVFEYDPFRERILQRLWDGVAEEIHHFSVDAPKGMSALFSPSSLFGSEAMYGRP